MSASPTKIAVMLIYNIVIVLTALFWPHLLADAHHRGA